MHVLDEGESFRLFKVTPNSSCIYGGLSWWSYDVVANLWCCTNLDLVQGVHFKNEFMDVLRQYLKLNYHFTTSYPPWPNGTL